MFSVRQKYVSMMVLATLLIQSVVAPVAFAGGGTPEVVAPTWYAKGSAMVARFNARCAAALEKAPRPVQLVAKAAGWATLVIPSARSMSEANRFYNIFVERPLMGIITAGAGVATTFAVNSHFLATDDPWRNGSGPEWDNGMFLKRAAEIWWSFNTSNIPRLALSLYDMNFITRFMLDWWASATTYIIGTAGPDFIRAMSTGSSELMTLSIAKSLFALQWPIISRPIGQWLNIYLFSRFLSQDNYKKVLAPGFDLEKFVAEKQAVIEASEKKIPQLRAKVAEARAALGETIRGTDILGKQPEQLTAVDYRTAATAAEAQPAQSRARRTFDRLNVWFTAREALRKERAKPKNAAAEIKWARFLRAGTDSQTEVPDYRRVIYRAAKQVVETTVGGSVLVLYLFLRDWSVGEAYDPNRLNQSGADWILRQGGFFEAMQERSSELTPDATPSELANLAADLQPVMEEQLEAHPEIGQAISEYVRTADPAQETMLISVGTGSTGN